MWMLTPEFCSTIPTKKANRCVFTLTGKGDNAKILEEDQLLLNILLRNYDEVNFWIQGDLDFNYLNRMKNIEKINIIHPSIEAYDSLLSEDDLDYVGTRLHGGVYAMRHRKRAIIIAIDERATEINRRNRLNCIAQKDIDNKLEKMIQSEFTTEVKMPYEAIEQWREHRK